MILIEMMKPALDALRPMTQPARVHVLIPNDEAGRFDAYCKEKGFKKSTLIVRLIREHLDRERFEAQQEMFSPRRVQQESKL